MTENPDPTTCEVFQALTWEAGDQQAKNASFRGYYVRVYGRRADGQLVAVTAHGFQPFLYVEAYPQHPSGASVEAQRRALQTWLDIFFQPKSTSSSAYGGGRPGAAAASPPPEHVGQLEVEYRRNLYGYHADPVPLIRIPFITQAARRKALWEFNKIKTLSLAEGVGAFAVRLYDAAVDNLVRFCHLRDLPMAGWIQCRKGVGVAVAVREDRRQTTAVLEYEVPWTELSPAADQARVAPFVQMSWDIETLSPGGGFPNADVADNAVCMLAFQLQRLGEPEPFQKVCLALGTIEPWDPTVTLECFPTEGELLHAFVRHVQRADPDVMFGYNVFQFDIPYLQKRMARHGGTLAAPVMSRRRFHACSNIDTTVNTKQSGSIRSVRWDLPGRIQLDLYPLIKKEYKLKSYRLDNVGLHFLKEQKHDMDFREMNRLMAHGTPQERVPVAAYCVQDTRLPQRLCDKLAIFMNLLEMANVTKTSLDMLLYRGMQVRCFSLLVHAAHRAGYAVPQLAKMSDADLEVDEGYEGATVLEPKPGFYEYVVTFDFQSLYPSIIIANNLCYSTWVPRAGTRFGDLAREWDNQSRRGGAPPPEAAGAGTATDAAAKAEPSTATTTTDPAAPAAAQVFGDGQTFVQVDGPGGKVGLLPEILKFLLAERKKTKKLMQAAPDAMAKMVLDAKQLAYKVACNSMYGFTGAVRGFLPCVDIAATVTAIGRNMILRTREYVEQTWGFNVVYGDTDSVFVEYGFPESLREAGPADKMRHVFEWAQAASPTITEALFRPPCFLDFEKVYSTLLMVCKKRYSGLKYTELHKRPDKLDSKGLQNVRRDSCDLVTKTLNHVLDELLINHSPAQALAVAETAVDALFSQQVPWADLALSQSLNAAYKDRKLAKRLQELGIRSHEAEEVTFEELVKVQAHEYQSSIPAHAQLAARLHLANPMTAPQPGDRVQYVFVERAGLAVDAPRVQHMATLEEAQAQHLKADARFYWDSQLETAIMQVLTLACKGVDVAARLQAIIARHQPRHPDHCAGFHQNGNPCTFARRVKPEGASREYCSKHATLWRRWEAKERPLPKSSGAMEAFFKKLNIPPTSTV